MQHGSTIELDGEPILFEGWLDKKSKYLGWRRKRWIVLTAKCIYSFKNQHVYDTPTEIFYLSIYDKICENTSTNQFEIISSKDKSYKNRVFCAYSYSIMNKWYKYIKYKGNIWNCNSCKCINDLNISKCIQCQYIKINPNMVLSSLDLNDRFDYTTDREELDDELILYETDNDNDTDIFEDTYTSFIYPNITPACSPLPPPLALTPQLNTYNKYTCNCIRNIPYNKPFLPIDDAKSLNYRMIVKVN